MILGANSTIVGVDGLVAGVAGGDKGGPLYITGGEIGGSSERTRRCSSSFLQGYGSISSFSSERVGQ